MIWAVVSNCCFFLPFVDGPCYGVVARGSQKKNPWINFACIPDEEEVRDGPFLKKDGKMGAKVCNDQMTGSLIQI